jgi:hypothetical protein
MAAVATVAAAAATAAAAVATAAAAAGTAVADMVTDVSPCAGRDRGAGRRCCRDQDVAMLWPGRRTLGRHKQGKGLR